MIRVAFAELSQPVAAAAADIQRTIIAERVLGLPKGPR